MLKCLIHLAIDCVLKSLGERHPRNLVMEHTPALARVFSYQVFIFFCFSHGAASGLDVTMEGSHSVTQSLSHPVTQSDRQSWDITLASAITLV